MKKEKTQIEVNEISESTKKSMKTRIITAIIALAVVSPFVFVGDWFLFVLIFIASGIAFWEIVHSTKKDFHPLLYVVTILIGLAYVCFPILLKISQGNAQDLVHAFMAFDKLYISISLTFVGIAIFFLGVILHSKFTVRDACYIFVFVLLVSLGFQSILYIRYIPSLLVDRSDVMFDSYFNLFDNLESLSLFAYPLIGTFATDIGAYFIGVFFGKHKINERISPKKTYEGFIGGLVISSLLSFGFAMLLAVLKHPILPGYLDLEHWYYILILSLIIPWMATLGDFTFSAAKRHYDIKDFSNILPGHGGVLDRLDSIVFAFIAAAIFISIITGATFI